MYIGIQEGNIPVNINKVKLILRKERVRDESHGFAVLHGGRVTPNLMGNSVHPLK